jgi:hypothetical protein
MGIMQNRQAIMVSDHTEEVREKLLSINANAEETVRLSCAKRSLR